MNKWILILLCISVLTTVVLIFITISISRERNYFMQVNSKYWKELQFLKYPDGAPVLGAKQDLENRLLNALHEVAEGCKIIENQKATINSLKALLKQSQDRNRMQKRRK